MRPSTKPKKSGFGDHCCRTISVFPCLTPRLSCRWLHRGYLSRGGKTESTPESGQVLTNPLTSMTSYSSFISQAWGGRRNCGRGGDLATHTPFTSFLYGLATFLNCSVYPVVCWRRYCNNKLFRAFPGSLSLCELHWTEADLDSEVDFVSVSAPERTTG